MCQLLDILGLQWWLNERSVLEYVLYITKWETFDNIEREIWYFIRVRGFFGIFVLVYLLIC